MNTNTTTRQRILTGDRPTGRLHLGHYVGSLQDRVALQYDYDTFIIVADVQALTTNFDRPEALAHDVRQVTLDNLAVGMDPDACTILVQSLVPAIAELTVLYSMLVTVNALRHNPTIKTEAIQRGYKDLTYGFLGYPVSQAADITFCRAHLVPVGDDQMPHIELTRKIVRRFNDLYPLPGSGEPVFPVPAGRVGRVGRLVGLDGQAKMSKSLDNCIYLDDTPAEVARKVRQAVTDPARIHASDPGHPAVCTVFAYHQAVNEEFVPELEAACRAGCIGCVACKDRLARVINALLAPMHERRASYLAHPAGIDEVLAEGTRRARAEGEETMRRVRQAMRIDYFSLDERAEPSVLAFLNAPAFAHSFVP
ncbi:MAG: tryptophan--tRNA ligase [Chloroflexi bacterium]|nr:tryptophan--tRNA ligase [Chloroflexota bacterium]MBU1746801.1 tryptophan--tRNA ligase [Chloroflexota bacterium]MBU1879598.1 tryptophan--tRNA ligase [Chloroflexota bacterium]